MSPALVNQTNKTALSGAPTTPSDTLTATLKNILYPGASDESVGMVLAYCQAAQLDPMTKPVHIVPMYDSKTKRKRDVIMPGIGLYRIQAARTGQYAGVSEPEYGPDTTVTLDRVNITVPAWCKVVVRRALSNGTIAEFAATERWIENYATEKHDSRAPNSMWKKRPYAQLAKCAEAQALRKAFPEIGAQPTAEEMEGKALDAHDAQVITHAEQTIVAEAIPPQRAAIAPPAPLPAYPASKFYENLPKWQDIIESGKSTAERIITMIQSKASLTEDQKLAICDLAPPDDMQKAA